jgi:cytidine deaminase
LLAEDGTIYVGCNVENASYGLTVCAERAAVANAVVRGARQYRDLAIVTEGTRAVAPCGACRQVLSEFAPDLRIVSEARGERREWTLAELLPEPFDKVPTDLH